MTCLEKVIQEGLAQGHLNSVSAATILAAVALLEEAQHYNTDNWQVVKREFGEQIGEGLTLLSLPTE